MQLGELDARLALFTVNVAMRRLWLMTMCGVAESASNILPPNAMPTMQGPRMRRGRHTQEYCIESTGRFQVFGLLEG